MRYQKPPMRDKRRGQSVLGRIRRRVFRGWIGISILGALCIGVVAPVVEAAGRELWLPAIIVPALMLVLLAVGLAWLVWLSSRQNSREDRGIRSS